MHIDLLLHFIAYIALGCFAGLLSGLMGAGGGLATVPGLAFILQLEGVNPELIMHVAIGTTLAKMVFVATRSLLAHLKHKIRFFYIYKKMVPGVMGGVIVGGVIAHYIQSNTLRIIFGVFVLYMAVQLYFQEKLKEKAMPGHAGLLAAGSFVGLQSGLLGIGGSAFAIPYLTRHGVSIRIAVVVSVAFAITVAFMGAITFMIMGLHVPNLPPYSTGYVYWPAWAGIVAGGIFMAPYGAKLSHYLSPKKLKQFFALFLVLIGLHMLIPL